MSAPESADDLDPRRVKAARALLAWSQQDLARAAKVATSTVADFERGRRTPVANNAQAMRAALESEGIRFLPTGAVMGPAAPTMAPSARPGMPLRWVTAADLAEWANRMDGALGLPTLVAFLIRATHGTAVRLRFPADEGVRHPGWDGWTEGDVASQYVPSGVAGWELTAQRSGIAAKVDEDYRKRTDKPEGIPPAAATFVFVTLQHWPQKGAWVAARKAEGPWRDVRVYDADDLVHWIEQTPAVGLWLANRLNKRPEGTRELDAMWEEWSRATQWPLTEALVLSDRDQDAAALLRWLRGTPSVLSLQATTADEVVAFFHAALSELPDEQSQAYRARTLVLTTAAAARAMVHAQGPLILLLTEPEPGLARTLADRGHFVLQAYDGGLAASGPIHTLARPSRDGITSALVAAGIAEPRAAALARDSARNLAILRRRIPSAPGRRPLWAEGPPPHALLAALLAGGWDDAAEADKARLSELADAPYDRVIAALAPFVGRFDSPLQKVGSTWRIASPSDAWPLLACHLTPIDIARFEATAHAVLGSADPRFELDPGERWMAAIKGIRPAYSGMLRHGIGQVLILLALWGDQVTLVPEAGRRADAIVARLLQDADGRRWWSLSRDFRLLAEASPQAFLSAIEDSLDQSKPSIAALFGRDDDGLFGTEYLSDLMWALESLAWSPQWMSRVTQLLARLDAIDVKPRRLMNGPAHSLRTIHLLWSPQTYATLDQRLRALDSMRRHQTDAAWGLMLGILPQGHDMSMHSPLPLWRDFSVDQLEEVTWALVHRGALQVSERLLEDVGADPARWTALLDRLRDLAPGPERALEALAAAEPRITDIGDRTILWDRLREILHRHRQSPGAKWSLPVPVLDRLAAVYAQIAPSDALQRLAWLFQHVVQLPNPSAEGWQAMRRDVDAARVEAARALHAGHGIGGVLALARQCEAPGSLGQALHDGGLADAEADKLIEAAARSDTSCERAVAHGLIVSGFRTRGADWGARLIARVRVERWGDDALMTVLHALPISQWTWDQVAAIGDEAEVRYWKRTSMPWPGDDGAELATAARKLIKVGRARHALALTDCPGKVDLPSDLIVELLQKAASQPVEDDASGNESTMFQYRVAEAIAALDERGDVDRGTLAMLEWNYLRLLKDSQRPPKVLLHALSEEPALFMQMLSAIFRPSEESGVVEPAPEDADQARAFAEQAYRLLELWDRLPGMRDDGSIDAAQLEAWIKQARMLAKAAGREGIADDRIGHMLSASPMGQDGNWPAEAVRDMLDLFRSKPMLDGFRVGKMNRRGVTSRSPRDGGALERAEAAKYRAWAKAVIDDHPRTAQALGDLADGYERDGKRHDDDAERLDWEA